MREWLRILLCQLRGHRWVGDSWRRGESEGVPINCQRCGKRTDTDVEFGWL